MTPAVHRDALTPKIDQRGERRLFIFANGIYSDHTAGGDIHFLELAKAAAAVGYRILFFGAKPLYNLIPSVSETAELVLTDAAVLPGTVEQSFSGQVRLLRHYLARFCRTVLKLRNIRRSDFTYAVADSWFDAIPVALSPSRRKLMILHMEAPSLLQILRRSRADVDRFRLASLHYWASQQISLRVLRLCRQKHVLYVNPAMRSRLLKLGFHDSEISFVSFGLDEGAAAQVVSPAKLYDVAWIGRVHRQKGIDDLLTTLRVLSDRVPDFKAILIGRGAEALRPNIEQLQLDRNVSFAGGVTEEEKYRLLKSSRVFLMPSRYEGSPRTVGEAIACEIPVIAYDVPTYRPVFGDLLRYVPCFDQRQFAEAAQEEIIRQRSGQGALDREKLSEFKRRNSWEAVHATFLQALETVEQQSAE